MTNRIIIPLSILNNSIISPRYLLYFNVGRFNVFNLSLYDLLSVLKLILWLFSVHVPVYFRVARYCHDKLSVCPSVCLSVPLSVYNVGGL